VLRGRAAAEREPLHRITVLATTFTRAASYSARLLADLGATVSVLVEGKADVAKSDLLVGQRVIDSQAFLDQPTWPDFDVVIEDLPNKHRLRDRLGTVDSPLISLSWHGRKPARQDRHGSDIGCQARGGVADLIGDRKRPPLVLPHRVGEYFLGAHGAAAALYAIAVSARGSRVDIALTDVWAQAVRTNAFLYSSLGIEYRRAGRRAPGSGGPYPYSIFDARDGTICLIGRSARDWRALVAAMGNPTWAELPQFRDVRAMGRDNPDEVDSHVAPWLLTRTRKELIELGGTHGFPIAPVLMPAQAIKEPPLGTQGYWVPAGTHVVPGPLVRAESWTPGPAPAERHTTPQLSIAAASLTGVRILDLSWVWAGPMIGAACADFGAEVIKVEHGKRLDNVRTRGRPLRKGKLVDGDPRELDPYVHTLNRGKKSFCVDLKSAMGRELFLRLVAKSDVVIESFSPGVLDELELGYEVLSGANTRIVQLSIRGAEVGPVASRAPSYAPITSSLGGLEALLAYPGRAPVGAMAFGFADPNAGIHGLAIILAALIDLRRTGRGGWFRLSQLEALAGVLREAYLPAQGIDSSMPEAMMLECLDGYVAVTLDDPASKRPDPALVRDVARRRATDLLRRRGFMVEPVQTVNDHRRAGRRAALSAPVRHPIYGREELIRVPWLATGINIDVRRSAPLIGEHTMEIACDVLQVAREDASALVDSGVLA